MIKKVHDEKVYTTLDFPLYKKYYYIVDFRNLMNPKILPMYFTEKVLAKRARDKKYGPKYRGQFKVVKGSKIAHELLPYIKSEGTLGANKKYIYPKEVQTKKEKRNYRILMRRRLRRMGIFTIVNPKKPFDEKPDYIKLIKNTQIKANTKNTSAKAFRLIRKPKRYIYLLVEKRDPKHRSYLITLKVIRINTKDFSFKYQTLHILKTDLIQPLIMKEVNQILKNAPNLTELYRFGRDRGLKIEWHGNKNENHQ